MKKWVLCLGIVVFLFCGCGPMESGFKAEDILESETREVSSESRGLSRTYLGIGIDVETDLKESRVVYEDAPMVFQDKAVEEMFRNMLEKPEGEMYIRDLQKIHAIYWNDKGYWSNLQSPEGMYPHVSGNEGPWDTKQLESFADLAYCYNLQWLGLPNGIEIPSLEPLFGLTQLEVIELDGTNVTEELLTELGNLSTVKRIIFRGNVHLDSIGPLLKLPQLEVLEFERATVTELVLEEIGRFSELKYLEFGNGIGLGELTDGSFLLPIADQLIYLWAAGGIDWSSEVLAQMTNLEALSLYYGEDLSFLEKMPKLKWLKLYCCNTKDWSPLSASENLMNLEICGNDKNVIEIALEDLTPLTNLDYLWINFTTINEAYTRDEIIEALPSLTGLVNSLW